MIEMLRLDIKFLILYFVISLFFKFYFLRILWIFCVISVKFLYYIILNRSYINYLIIELYFFFEGN